MNADGTSPTKKKMSKGQQEEQNKKLYYNVLERKKDKDAKRIAILEKGSELPRKKLNQADQGNLVTHLYTKELERINKQGEKRQAELAKLCPTNTKKLSGGAMADSVDRMYYQEKSRRAIREDALIHKYQPATTSKVLTTEQANQVNDRLYGSEKDKFPQMRARLWQKHIAPLETTFPKKSAEELKAMADRLSTGKAN
eukprot:NODE_1538_length_860_cov_265.279901_g1193_i0.p1 GENE.NODE_1538_length_860_cov_265.279901_g1193_i0~~NODE_1538_length_860_cov_265.279901_g1193_i0.p1  ORF type:complete len:198 (-),score=45.67 NODE_1538_length_860_cov_265.279901_g1193_i0:195-788(-)